MTESLADSLAKRYINNLETAANAHIVALMDLFNSSVSADSAQALNTLLKVPLSNVHLSYQTWNEYLQGIADKRA